MPMPSKSYFIHCVRLVLSGLTHSFFQVLVRYTRDLQDEELEIDLYLIKQQAEVDLAVEDVPNTPALDLPMVAATAIVILVEVRLAVKCFSILRLLNPPDRAFTPRDQLPLPSKPPYTAHLGNLSFDVTQADIQDFFAACGVSNVRLVEDKLDRKPKGFGYVEFASLDGLKKALDLNGNQFQGRNVRISIAEPRKSAFSPEVWDTLSDNITSQGSARGTRTERLVAQGSSTRASWSRCSTTTIRA